jgi:hypothetical protein
MSEHRKGKVTQVFSPEQLEILERFLLYREFLGIAQPEYTLDIIRDMLLEQQNSEYEVILEILEKRRSELVDTLEELDSEIARLQQERKKIQ